jgi:microcystin-dependent protein
VSVISDDSRSEATAGPSDERPLTDDERKLVTRLLADPISFPQSYKTWLVAFLEGSDLTLPINSILGLNSILSPSGGGAAGIMGVLPPGLIFPCAAKDPPNGTLLCDGRTVSKTSYARLYKVLGTQWGPEDADLFTIPDIQGRMIVGYGPGHSVNENEGRAPINRGPAHHHYFIDTPGFGADGYTDTQGSHQHSLGVTAPKMANAADSQVAIPTTSGGGTFFTDSQGSHGHNVHVDGSVQVQGDTSGGGDQDKPSYIVIPYVINY